MKNTKLVKIIFGLCLVALFIAILFSKATNVFAASEYKNLIFDQVVSEMFGDRSIKSAEYLYNLNDSPDFVYVDFDDYGYAVFLRESLELLEYAPTGNLPYLDTTAIKYYGGPTNYLRKTADQTFTHIDTKDTFSISSAEIENYSKSLLDAFSRSSIVETDLLGDINL